METCGNKSEEFFTIFNTKRRQPYRNYMFCGRRLLFFYELVFSSLPPRSLDRIVVGQGQNEEGQGEGVDFPVERVRRTAAATTAEQHRELEGHGATARDWLTLHWFTSRGLGARPGISISLLRGQQRGALTPFFILAPRFSCRHLSLSNKCASL